MDLFQIIKNAPIDQVIGDNLVIAFSKVNGGYKNILCSISGGWDSDEVLHIVQMVDIEKKVRYIWFNTGLEYDATKEHIKMLEEKYGIVIEEFKAKKPIPVCCKEYGQPFMSKQISEYIQRLQKHSFQWENEPFEVLLRKYPKCKVALRWWCNEFGEGSRFNISAKRWLKEYMLENPPKFRISNKCCEYAKKLVAADAKRQLNCDLNIIGVRKAEGGARATAYKNCFSNNIGDADEYRPVFFYTKKTREVFDKHYGISHSKCYTEYGLDRTGCAGCPYSKYFEHELDIIKEHEPKLYIAVNNIFGDSYAYTRGYLEFRKMMDQESKRRN